MPELDLYNYKARIYSPYLGRFLQTDPTGYDDGLNWYAYVGNDPLNHSDPTGTECYDSDGYPISSCTTLKQWGAAMTFVAAGEVAGPIVGFGGRLLVGAGARWVAGAIQADRIGAQVASRGVTFQSTFQRAQSAVKTIENIMGNNAAPKDFAGVLKEGKGVKTGFDHITEMENSVRGLKGAVGRIDEALGNTKISPEQAKALEAWKGAAQNTIKRMEDALSKASGT